MSHSASLVCSQHPKQDVCALLECIYLYKSRQMNKTAR
uniref:Uncharacterized protein n=1 Tax=Arundo donax TaxID=35708 RepID=A0A0A9GWX3_ARUDO